MYQYLVRYYSAVRQHYYFFARAVGRRRALQDYVRKTADLPSNSGSAHFQVSWLLDFIFYQKPLYKSLHQSFFYSFIRFTSCPQKVVLHSITARFSLRPYYFVISHPFWNICHVTSRKLRLPQYIMRDYLHINKQTNIFIVNHRCLLRQNN